MVNNSGHRYDLALDIVPGARFVYMTEGNINPTQVDRLTFQLTQAIAHSENTDFLLLSGAPILNALAGMLWISRHPACNLLIFDAKEQGYVRQVVNRENLQKMIDRELFR